MPHACSRCGSADGIPLYATSLVRYFGCAKCRHLNVVPNGMLFDQSAGAAAPRSDGDTRRAH
jgi:hypothetical protein